MSCSRTILRFAVGSAMLLTAVSVSAQTKPATPALSPEQSCKAYVQKFYDWYLPVFAHGGNEPSDKRAINSKRFGFDKELRKRLLEDLQASAKVSGEVVGLDFDPFLAAQDTSDRYLVRRAEMRNDHCWASVAAIQSGQKINDADVLPELTLRDGRWVFVNFHYPSQDSVKADDLLSLLKRLAEDRRRSP
jgi:hypothetical protein